MKKDATPRALILFLRSKVEQRTLVDLAISTRLEELKSTCKYPRVFLLKRKGFFDEAICISCGTYAKTDIVKALTITKRRKFFAPHSPSRFYNFVEIFKDSYPTLAQTKDVGLSLIYLTE